jgi:all-trans-nonaprenyl-diphosphate synthase
MRYPGSIGHSARSISEQRIISHEIMLASAKHKTPGLNGGVLNGACITVGGRHRAPFAVRAQALGSIDSEDTEGKRIPRGTAAGPLRVLTPLREASAALANTLQEMATTSGLLIDPTKVSLKNIRGPVDQDMEICRQNLVDVVGKRHPLLRAAADQIFSAGGKRLRPLIVLLVSRATYSMTGLLDITERHRRLAEITEMIHTASLVHDDVLDDCGIRRGKKTVNNLYGTRVAVLVGDFLFAQSSWFLANLDNLEVIKLISQVIADFADGEISQAASLFDPTITLEQYLDKSFYKTASLVAASCRGAAVFSECSDEVKLAMYEYGRHLGLAFQVVDDILDFTQSTAALGKPQGQDLASGNLTAPVLFALEDRTVGPRLLQLLQTRFKDEGSLVEALNLVQMGGGIERARLLAREEADKALAALQVLPSTPAKESLAMMVEYVLERLY